MVQSNLFKAIILITARNRRTIRTRTERSIPTEFGPNHEHVRVLRLDPLPMRVPPPTTLLLPQEVDQEAPPDPVWLQRQIPQVQGPPHSHHIHEISRRTMQHGSILTSSSKHAKYGKQHKHSHRVSINDQRID